MSESISAHPPQPTEGPSPIHRSSLTSEPPDSLPKNLRASGKSPPLSTWISAANNFKDQIITEENLKDPQFLLTAATSPNNLFLKED